ncbi:methyl-accepting chemotaxis protein [Marinilabiliaceae bacterium JC017]|nr:methyl-accepting chemotaxis protein [Marinilabiliaceae bacterium JC017]
MTWKDLKLAQKLQLSFGTFLLILFIFGGLAVFELIRIRSKAQSLSDIQIPSLSNVNSIERNWQNAIFNLRSYGYSKDEVYYQKGISHLAKAQEELNTLSLLIPDHPASSPHIKALKKELIDFQALAQRTRHSFQEVFTSYVVMDSSSQILKQQCENYLQLQYKKLKKDVDRNKDKHIIKRRADKIDLMNNVMTSIDQLNTVIWRAEVENNPDLIVDDATIFKRIRSNIETIRPMTTKAYDIATLNTIISSASAYESSLHQLIENWKENRQLKNNTAVNRGIELTQQLSKIHTRQATDLALQNASLSGSSQRLMLWGLVALIIISLLLSRFLTKTISAPILALVGYAKKMAQGHLPLIPTLEGQGETAILTRSLKQSGDKLRNIVSRIQDMSSHLNELSSRLSNKAHHLTDTSNTQASNAEEITASMEEMSSLMTQSSDNARKCVHTTTNSSATIRQEIAQTQEAMAIMNQLISKAAAIHEIASQTYILSINASIEAAKAGERGRGFSVVAKGIRDLAEKSKELAADLGKMSSKGIEVSRIASKNLVTIEKEMTRSVTFIQEIADSVMEQESESTQITTSLQQFNILTQQTAQMAEEITAEAQIVEADARSLQQIIHFFKLENRVGKRDTTTNNPTIHQFKNVNNKLAQLKLPPIMASTLDRKNKTEEEYQHF